MSQEILAPQWGKTLTFDGVADKEFHIFLEDLTQCVNDFSGGSTSGSITINGVEITDLTLQGRSTDFSVSGDGKGVYTHFDNFSYHVTPKDEVFNIPASQQMIVHNGIEIEGILDVEGELILE